MMGEAERMIGHGISTGWCRCIEMVERLQLSTPVCQGRRGLPHSPSNAQPAILPPSPAGHSHHSYHSKHVTSNQGNTLPAPTASDLPHAVRCRGHSCGGEAHQPLFPAPQERGEGDRQRTRHRDRARSSLTLPTHDTNTISPASLTPPHHHPSHPSSPLTI